jgi:uncharacterized protein YndB with AHSA1/START domain
MKTESIRVSSVIPASPEQVYAAWLDSREHSRMTGGKASVVARRGGRHTAWDGYIEGRTVALARGRRIVQDWRTTEFPKAAPDSKLEIVLAAAPGGTRITIVHTRIPIGQGERYRIGWQSHYFAPMQRYFAAQKAKTATKKKTGTTKPTREKTPVAKAKPAARKTKAPARKKRAAKKTKAAPAKKTRAPAKKAAKKKARRK